MEGIKVTRQHKPIEVRKETARRTEVNHWKGEIRWWQEFLDARARFLREKAIPESVREYIQLEREFGEWVESSLFWWGGDWARKKEGAEEENDLAQWHVWRYMSTKKYAGKAVVPNEASKVNAISEPEQGISQPKPFFDPVMDEFRQY